jgi:photosystem II stability/assembly factor-like uncharacterized protein
VIHVATAGGLFVIGSRRQHEFEDRDVTALARGTDSWWAITDGHAVWRRAGTADWEPVAEVGEYRLNCVLPVENGALVGTSNAHLLRLDGGTVDLVEAFERTEGRADWYTPWGGPPDVRSLSRAPGSLWANVHVGGILRSDDGGHSWKPTIDIDSDVHEVLASDDGFIAAATAWGLALSDDGGVGWSFDTHNLHASYARAVGRCGDTILMTSCVGPHGGRAALYRRPVGDRGAFEKCEEGLPEWFGDNIDTGCLAASGKTAAFGTSDGEVFVSGDAGRSWERIASALPPVRWLELG